ncbi:MAG: hypothetical protein P0S96_02605 [Simkaniaceae bacterium]|nr:hypothetical protein [Candidatus Sacchlamyda saccharinae]
MDQTSFQAKEKAISLADQLLNEEGRFKKFFCDSAPFLFSLDDYIEDGVSLSMQRKIYGLQSDKELIRLVEGFSLPLFDSKYEKMFLEFLNAEKLTHRYLIMAVLSALFCPLRQQIGSCFATAPAIIVHEEQPEQFLRDLKELLYTGKLTRVIAGVEYTVPISPTAGRFDEHPLLKIWEYSIASFVDVKTEFSRWNLYESLGLHHEEKEGIGELLYGQLNQTLAETNEELSKVQQDYEIAFDQVRLVEAQLRNASSESEIRRLRAEHQVKSYHFTSLEHQRADLSEKSHNIANFFPFLIDQFIERFQDQFQEVYDAEMQEIPLDTYDDAPAGFRLLYKHGRTHVRSWTFIYNEKEYIDALKEFFRSVEHPIQEAAEWGKEEVSHFITRIIHHLDTEEFLRSAFQRMAKAHRSAYGEKKPWAYTSGGTLTTLLKTYFKREAPFSKEEKWIESPQELLIFLLDTLKAYPPKEPEKRMLMTSPTHVFSLLPNLYPFKQGYEDPGFTYTWVRDQILGPRRAFYEKIILTPHEQHLILQELELIQRTPTPLSLADFRSQLPQDPEIDGKLFELLPIITPTQAESLIGALGLNIQPPSQPTFRSHLFQTLIHHHPPEKVARAMEERGLAPPRPLLFADTNWAHSYFSFVVNPATGLLEFWRTDPLGQSGTPMTEWTPYLDGTSKHPWSLFPRPHEYVMPNI